ncbi:unnamed protein product [Moneuplotes crassus]|uniref:Cyclin N-terminal domain-containing protein n=1 Tax=Euplotes crassus TaxID=5936 RepID=A0AAD1Y7H0_EUPCR|nr:unnamed protein product [Moneuplotes crassus]
MSVTRKTDVSSDPSLGSVLYHTARRPSKGAKKYMEHPKSAEEAARSEHRNINRIVLREPGCECHSGSELKEVYASMLSTQFYHGKTAKKGYLKYRRVLVDWMCEIGDTIKQSYTTIHHAVCVMDNYFSKHEDVKSNEKGKRLLKLVALTSIFISAKYCEKDSKGPTARNISMLTRGEFSEEEILYFEGLILQKIGWNLMFTTPADFISLFLNQGIVYSDDLVFTDEFASHPRAPSLKNIRYVRKYCEFFVDLCLQEQSFQKYSCIILAISIILAARKSVNISPIWNDEFSRLFMMNFKHVEKCYIEIYSFYEASFPNQTKAIIKPAKVIPSIHKTKPKKENRSVGTRYTSSETSHRNRSSTKSSRRSKKELATWNLRSKHKGKRSTNSSLLSHKADLSREVKNITTPDKFIALHQKNSSSNKKSTLKKFRPQNVSLRRAVQTGMSGSSNKKKLKIRYKNKDAVEKMPLKLDFNTKSITNLTKQSKFSNRIPKAPQTKRNSQIGGTFYKANYDQKPKLSSRNNMPSYSGMYSTLDNGKHHISQQEDKREYLLTKAQDSSSCQRFSNQYDLGNTSKDSSCGIRKIGYNWAINNVPSWKKDKSKNYSSMSSLMNRPSEARKQSFQKPKPKFTLSNSSSFMLTKENPTTDKAQLAKRSKLHKNIFHQIGTFPRSSSSSTRPKNPSGPRSRLEQY